MNLRLRLFLIFGGLLVLVICAQWWVFRSLGEDLRLESHGHWRMKGVSEPIELFEVGDENAPFQPPPDAGKVYRVVERNGLWLPIREVKHSLPAAAAK